MICSVYNLDYESRRMKREEKDKKYQMKVDQWLIDNPQTRIIKVKIISSSKQSWYSDKIGEVLEIYNTPSNDSGDYGENVFHTVKSWGYLLRESNIENQ